MISQPANLVRGLVLIIAATNGISACSSYQPAPDARQTTSGAIVRPKSTTDVGGRAVSVAIGQVGVPYRYGGSTPNGFDCSGLVYYSYGRVGKSVPRTTGQLWKGTRPVARRDIRAGDILFFSISGKMSHVGISLGDDQFVHAPSSGKTVSIETLNSDYYRKAFIRAGRPN